MTGKTQEEHSDMNNETDEIEEESVTRSNEKQDQHRGTIGFKTVKDIFRKQKKVALIIDGPNILRRVGGKSIRLEDIESIANKIGQIKIAKVILNRHAPRSLLKAIENSGYDPIVASTDVYIRMAIEIMDCVFSKNTDIVIIASRHARCAPILRAVKANGLDTGIIGFQPGFSVAVKNAADMAFRLKI
ncbi:NYN domain-containing protein [Candidatus Heimdallarchaeota archaeon]|jgi:uncharacterized protein (TIGR00288 family)|nr:MAG: NYN domain-containing protein [Candidatus Heimdallarchaeota archaeon]